jgi:hypothetical protein
MALQPSGVKNVYVGGARETDKDSDISIYFTQEAQAAMVDKEAQMAVMEALEKVPH